MNETQLKVIIYCDNLSGTHFIKNSVESIDDTIALNFSTVHMENFEPIKDHSSYDACLFWLKKENDFFLVEKLSPIMQVVPLIVIADTDICSFSKKLVGNPSFELIWKKDLNPMFLVKTILNSAEKFNLRKEISNSKKRYIDLFYNTPLPLMIFDTTNEKVLRVNDEATKIFGYTEAEFMGFNIKQLQRIDNFNNTPIDISCPLNDNEVNFLGTFRFRTKEKELKYFDIFVKANSYIDFEYRLIMVTEVTKRVLFDQLLSKAIFEAQENERFELGAELHDNVCQVLATGQLSLDLLDEFVSEENPFLKRGKEMFKLAIDEIRRLSHRLAPAFFDNSTLDYLLGGIKESTENGPFQLRIQYNESLYDVEFSKQIQLNLYRILQEQIQNIRKHAQATNVVIDVNFINEELIVKIKDDGIGFNTLCKTKGIGMSNIKRRIDKLNGEMIINSSAGMGCEIILKIPQEKILVS